MKPRVLFFLLLAAVALRAESDGKLVSVRLANGSRIGGRIVAAECTDEVLVLRELRTNAKRTVPWSDVDPKTARELRIELGFEVREQREALTMTAVEITNRSGSTFRGKLLNPDTAEQDGVYRLKTAEGERIIRLSDVLEGPEEVEVDVLLVYTPEELYRKRLGEGEPQTAEDHFRLAEYCRIVGALEAAKEHYEAVIAAGDPKYGEDMVQRLLERVEKRLGSREAEAALRQIKQAILYYRFDDIAGLLEAFRTKYQDEDLLADAQALEEEAAQRRTEYYVARVPRLLRREVKDLVAAKVREEEVTLRDAQKFAAGDAAAQTSATNQALLAVAEDLGIPPEEVLGFWNEREKRAVQRGFYRDGTFIVVENLEDALQRAPKLKTPKGGSGAAVKPPKPSERVTPEKWWERKRNARKLNELADWLYAFWGEESGMNEVLDPKDAPCPTCNGKGYVQHMHTTSQGAIPFFDRCQSCHMAGFHRIAMFR